MVYMKNGRIKGYIMFLAFRIIHNLSQYELLAHK